MSAPIILIDIDGVIAPFTATRVLEGSIIEEVRGFGDVIILADRIADLVRISEKTGAELLFHTSWETGAANDAFRHHFGRDLEALPDPAEGRVAIWWKLDAIEDKAAQWATEGRRVVWLDDMLADGNDFDETWGELGEAAAARVGLPLLTVTPGKYVGLTREHIAAIEGFLS